MMARESENRCPTREIRCQYYHCIESRSREFCVACPDVTPCDGTDDDHDNCRACYALDCPCMVTTTPLRDAVFEAWAEQRRDYGPGRWSQVTAPGTDRPPTGTREYQRWYDHRQERTCASCGRPIGDRNKSGHCRLCFSRMPRKRVAEEAGMIGWGGCQNR